MRRLQMCHLLVRIALALSLLAALGTQVAAQSQPDGQLTVAFDVSLAPSFLERAETPGTGTPFVILYAMHDALDKPLPGNDMLPSPAESWRESPDVRTYDIMARER